jgi:metaxin
MKFSGIDFQIVSSNNHASPSGALPFLLPSVAEGAKPPPPVPSAKLQRWTMNNSAEAIEEPGDRRYEAYLSLLDHRIRRAWVRLSFKPPVVYSPDNVQLYSIYLSPNSTSLAEPLYILPPSTNPFVRLAIARTLRDAASAELLKYSAVINGPDLYRQAEEAFAALEMALGSDEWFFGAKRPGLFDASVFAYTHLLLDEELGRGWVDTTLCDAVRARKNLVGHRERILAECFSGTRAS